MVININNGPSGFAFHTSDCSDTNWPGASAFVTLLALVLACVTQPAGSFLFYRSSRLWRASPFLAFAETFALLSYSVFAPLLIPGVSLRVICCCLLAVREGHLWSPERIEKFLVEEGEDARLVKQLRDEIFGSSTPALGVQRTSTIELEEAVSTAHGDLGSTDGGTGPATSATALPRSRHQAQATAAGQETTQSARSGERQPKAKSPYNRLHRKRMLSKCIRQHLKLAQKHERSVILRVIAFGLTILQIVKISTISGAPGTRFLAWIYIINWAIVEVVLLGSGGRHPLNEQELDLAEKLLKKWRSDNGDYNMWSERWGEVIVKSDDSETPESPPSWLLVIWSLWILLHLFAIQVIGDIEQGIQFLYVPSFIPKPTRDGDSTGVHMLKMLLFMTVIWPWMVLVFGIWIVTWTPIWLATLHRVLLWCHSRSGAQRFFTFPSTLYGVHKGAFWADAVYPLPDYAGVITFILGLLFYAGFGGWHYDCRGTVQPSFYNWLP